MPRLKHRHPSYRLHKPSGKAVVTLDGMDHYLSPFGSPASKAEYDRLVAEWLANGRTRARAAEAVRSDLTISELILMFWRHSEREYLRPDGSHGSEVEKIRLALKPLRSLYGATLAKDFDVDALEVVRGKMSDDGLSCRTINQRVTRIRRLFLFARNRKLIPGAVYQDLRGVPGIKPGRFGARPSKRIRPVPEDRVDAVRPYLSRQLQAVVDLQRLTGMRSGEVLAMRTCDLSMAWEYAPEGHKTRHHGKDRRIFIGPRAQEVLRPWLRAEPTELLFQPKEARAEQLADRRRARKTPLTPSQRARQRKSRPRKAPGERYDSRTYAHAVARACDRAFPHPTLAGIKGRELTEAQREESEAWHRAHRWHPHQLRHNAATSLRKQFGLDVARVILGHTSPAVTEIYAEADTEKARAVMGQIG